ncbi:ECF RNA polymerase sigma factor SigW [Posidoniimonas polymericola]|uniref:ECF RNA polymerase sigma factor SigW n=1 Tax=Posidoniimonas polymericola TaxID=2528002 RepID=A0A5C5YGH0_9BACT|nr:sigma-70 family RNA polymerase sigma factor [Posidoniimonas polymericola]TWT73495.1 ECF RNA polymerase sigma factor SigW [Posidoniimonas polymericola]
MPTTARRLLTSARTRRTTASPISATDGELLMRFRRGGDPQALAEILDRHAAMVWGVCRNVLHREADAQDAFQATFLILLRRADSIRASESAAGWLYRVALRAACDARRARLRRREAPLDDEPLQPEPAFPDIERRQLSAALMEELRALPDKYQTPLVLRYLEGLSRQEIADQLDTTVATVQGQLVRGKRQLRSRLIRRGVSLSVAMGVLAASRPAEAAPVGPVLSSGGAIASHSVIVQQLTLSGARSMMMAAYAKPLAVAATIAIAALVATAEDQSTLASNAVAGPASNLTVQLDATPVDADEGASVAMTLPAAPIVEADAAEPVDATPVAVTQAEPTGANRDADQDAAAPQQELVDVYRHLVEMVRQQHEQGVASTLALLTAERRYASAVAELHQIHGEREEALRQLKVAVDLAERRSELMQHAAQSGEPASIDDQFDAAEQLTRAKQALVAAQQQMVANAEALEAQARAVEMQRRMGELQNQSAELRETNPKQPSSARQAEDMELLAALAADSKYQYLQQKKQSYEQYLADMKAMSGVGEHKFRQIQKQADAVSDQLAAYRAQFEAALRAKDLGGRTGSDPEGREIEAMPVVPERDQYGPESTMKQGNWNAEHEPSELDPKGWAVIADLRLGEHMPVLLPGDPRPRPHMKLVRMAANGHDGHFSALMSVVDPGTDSNGLAANLGGNPTRVVVRGEVCELRQLGPGLRPESALVLLRCVRGRTNTELEQALPNYITATMVLTRSTLRPGEQRQVARLEEQLQDTQRQSDRARLEAEHQRQVAEEQVREMRSRLEEQARQIEELTKQLKLQAPGDKPAQHDEPQAEADRPALEDLPEVANSKVYVVGTYNGPEDKPLVVRVTKTGEPLTVVLSSYYWQDWKLEVGEGVDLKRVIVAGYNEQRIDGVIDGLPEGVPLDVYTYFPTKHARNDIRRPDGVEDRAFFWAYKEHSPEYFDLADKLRQITGREIESFQGDYTAQSFEIK